MTGSRIIIVEDELIISLEIKETLRRLGYEVVARVISGEDAIEKAGELKPDLILMDIRLEGEMDGITAAKRIIDLYDIPIIFLTGQSDEATLKRAIEISPSGYLVKPFNDRELFSNIEMSIHKHKVRKKLEPDFTNKTEVMDNFLRESPTPILYLDTSLEITAGNKAVEQLLGIPFSQIQNKSITSVITSLSDKKGAPSDVDPEKFLLLPDQIGINQKDGKKVPIQMQLGFILNREGFLQSIITSLNNTTSIRPQLSSGLVQAYEQFIQNLDIPVYIINREKVVVAYNQAFFSLCQQIGISQYQLQRPIFETKNMILFGESQQYDEVFKSGIIQKEGRKYRKNGKNYFIRVNRFPILEGNTVSHILTINFDITSEIYAKEDAKKTRTLFFDMMNTIDELVNQIKTLKPAITDLIHNYENTPGLKNSIDKMQIENITTLLQNIDMSWIQYSEIKEDLQVKHAFKK
ncbi:response regulator [Methanospirillum lacunae]|uniref:Response regulatory domain-containing protein n=1 Tax=Methanospirillum lacunae TaxID=668570 RepID=A0A2V2MNL6_9EURY|nr:response regulator [Methanospirillum lacunae]PWR69834.1 hypothetical protein DK846_16795 [Methanospirillum lacunae]